MEKPNKWWIVEGSARIAGAIGEPEKFTISTSANSLETVKEKVRQYLYKGGYEHVHIQDTKIVLTAEEVFVNYNWKVFCDLKNISKMSLDEGLDPDTDFTLTLDEAKAIGVFEEDQLNDDLYNVIADSITSD